LPTTFCKVFGTNAPFGETSGLGADRTWHRYRTGSSGRCCLPSLRR
jgi:hypothetical protein